MKPYCVIGNGFDILHGIRSRYDQFKRFVQEHDRELYQRPGADYSLQLPGW